METVVFQRRTKILTYRKNFLFILHIRDRKSFFFLKIWQETIERSDNSRLFNFSLHLVPVSMKYLRDLVPDIESEPGKNEPYTKTMRLRRKMLEKKNKEEKKRPGQKRNKKRRPVQRCRCILITYIWSYHLEFFIHTQVQYLSHVRTKDIEEWDALVLAVIKVYTYLNRARKYGPEGKMNLHEEIFLVHCCSE